MTEINENLTIDKRLSIFMNYIDNALGKPLGYLLSFLTWFILFAIPCALILGGLKWGLIGIIPAIFLTLKNNHDN